jgi:hypothetical protein
MPRGVSNPGQSPPAGLSMADKRVAPVVNRQHLEPSGAEHLARGPEALAERVTRAIEL